MDWKKARREYLAGGITYRQLAEKYGCAEKTIANRASKEKWHEAREQTAIKYTARAADAIARNRAEADALVYRTTLELIDAIYESTRALRQEGPLFPRSAKDFSDAVRALQQVLDAKPTEEDLEEQRARIEKLRKDAQRDDSKAAGVEVVFQGGINSYGV